MFLSMIVQFLQLPSGTMAVSIATGVTNILNCYKLSGLRDFVHPGLKNITLIKKQINIASI